MSFSRMIIYMLIAFSQPVCLAGERQDLIEYQEFIEEGEMLDCSTHEPFAQEEIIQLVPDPVTGKKRLNLDPSSRGMCETLEFLRPEGQKIDISLKEALIYSRHQVAA